jgi:putative FmdB family regulatory protein
MLMPIYEFKCNDCGSISEILCGVGKDEKAISCTQCGSKNVIKTISAPASVSVKGKSSFNSTSSDCCGMTNPCENPKRCCGK